MSIGLPPAPQEFIDDALDVINAMRTIRHHSVNGSATIEAVEDGVVQRTVQGTATFLRNDAGLTVAYEPDSTIAAGFEPVVFRLGRAAYPESPIWTTPHIELVDLFASHAGRMTENGTVTGYRIGAEPHECIAILEAAADDATMEIEGLVEDLSNGTDVAAGGAWTIRRRWSAFGTSSLAEPTGDGNVVYRVPGEDEPDVGRRQAGFRIRLLERFMAKLPPAIVIIRLADGTYDTMPHSLTRRKPDPEDATAVRQKAVQAFHRLTTMETEASA